MKRLMALGMTALFCACSSMVSSTQDDAEVPDFYNDSADAVLDVQIALDAATLPDAAQPVPPDATTDMATLDGSVEGALDLGIPPDAAANLVDAALDSTPDILSPDATTPIVSPPTRDTIVTLISASEYPAIVLTAQMDIAGTNQPWRRTTTVRERDIAVVVFDHETYSTDHLCRIRLSASFFMNDDDVDGNGEMVGTPSNTLCRSLANGEYDINPSVRVWIDVDNENLDTTNLEVQVNNGVCEVVFVRSAEGDCAL